MKILEVEEDTGFPDIDKQLRIVCLADGEDFLKHTIIVDETGMCMISKDLDRNNFIFDEGDKFDSVLNKICKIKPNLKDSSNPTIVMFIPCHHFLSTGYHSVLFSLYYRRSFFTFALPNQISTAYP